MSKMPSLMCHWVAGYPDAKGFSEVISVLDAHPGTTWLEIQLPFSDPLADGPVIMAANHAVLHSGQRTEEAFDLLDENKGLRNKKLALMTYASLPLTMGLERFMDRLLRCGANGLIVPDLPFDTSEGQALIEVCRSIAVNWIPVVSPRMNLERLGLMLAYASGMVYVTSKVGVTGTGAGEQSPALEMVHSLRSMTDLPVGLGFGIQGAAAVRKLAGVVDVAVIGSHLLRLYNEAGLENVAAFLKEI